MKIALIGFDFRAIDLNSSRQYNIFQREGESDQMHHSKYHTNQSNDSTNPNIKYTFTNNKVKQMLFMLFCPVKKIYKAGAN